MTELCKCWGKVHFKESAPTMMKAVFIIDQDSIYQKTEQLWPQKNSTAVKSTRNFFFSKPNSNTITRTNILCRENILKWKLVVQLTGVLSNKWRKKSQRTLASADKPRLIASSWYYYLVLVETRRTIEKIFSQSASPILLYCCQHFLFHA